ETSVAFDALWFDARAGKIIAYRLGAALRNFIVHIVRADRIGMAFDFERQLARIGEQDSGQLAEFLAGRGFERSPAGVEQHIAEIDDESPGLAFRVENF